MVNIVVDTLGSDNGSKSIVTGVIKACEELNPNWQNIFLHLLKG